MKVAELNNGQTVWTEQFTNFDPVTFMAVWHILGLNIGGSSKKAAGISPENRLRICQGLGQQSKHSKHFTFLRHEQLVGCVL